MKFFGIGIMLAIGMFTLIDHVSISADKVKVQKIDLQYAADFSDDKVLMGASHNVFTGKVIEQIDYKERGIGPETQFSVEVIGNIKGSLQGTVTVDQQGGYKDGTLYIVGDDSVMKERDTKDYLLQPGSTYLFATRYNKEQNWYTLNSYPTASKLLSADKNSNFEQLKTLALNDERVKQLKAAYPNEILIDADVKRNNTLNSYKSIKSQEQISESKPE
jgi:hypothetical protein